MAEKKVKSYKNEEWVKIKTEKPTRGSDYYFSSRGRMKSVNKNTESEKLLKGSRDKYGNVRLSLQLAKGTRQQFYLHRLIGDAFAKKETRKHKFLIHKDNSKENNSAKNLAWVTQEGLTAHQRKNGVFDMANRKRDPNYKLTESKVKALKKSLKAGRTKPEALATKYGITLAHVKLIQRGKRWAHVE